ncbi:unnamed protein product, partial [Heterosigma akashiwo]
FLWLPSGQTWHCAHRETPRGPGGAADERVLRGAPPVGAHPAGNGGDLGRRGRAPGDRLRPRAHQAARELFQGHGPRGLGPLLRPGDGAARGVHGGAGAPRGRGAGR